MRQNLRIVRHIAISVVALVGCAPPFQRAATAPKLPPSDHVLVVQRAPIGAKLLGVASMKVKPEQTGADCEAAALAEAKRAGATHVVMRPPKAPTMASQGPSCQAEAYYVP